MRRRTFHRSLAGATLGAFACGSEQPGPAAESVIVSTFVSVSMSTFYVAYERGYFEDAGLNVELAPITTSADATAMTAAGRIDIAMIGLTPSLLNAIHKGARLKLVAAREEVSSECPLIGTIYGRKSSFPEGLGDISQLRGRSVAIRGPASQSEFFLDMLLSSAGLVSSGLDLIMLREPEAIAALLDGSIDAMLNSSFEFDVRELSPEIIRGPTVADVIPGYQRAFAVFGPSMLDGGRDRCLHFLAALLRGARDYRSGVTPRFLVELAGKGRLGASQAEAICRETFVADGRINPRGIEIFSDWTMKRGYCERATAPEDIIDTSFLEELPISGDS